MILSLTTWESGPISLFFILFFLPLSLFFYYKATIPFRKTALLLISLLFIAFTTGVQIFVLLAFALLQFFLLKKLFWGAEEKKSGLFLALSMALSLAFLLVFSFILPSLSTFSLLGAGVLSLLTLNASIQIYWGRWPIFPALKDFLLFLCFYPRLFLGPFQSYEDFENSFILSGTLLQDLKIGFGRYLRGAFQVVFLGLRFSDLCLQVQLFAPGSMTSLSSWSLLLFATLSLYHLLAGFSLLISGIGRMYGLALPIDTRYPYESTGTHNLLHNFHRSLTETVGQNLYRFFAPFLPFPLLRKSFLVLLGGLMGLWLSPRLGFFLWGAFLSLWGLIERGESKKEGPTGNGKHPIKGWGHRLVTWLLFILAFVLLLVFQVNWPNLFVRNLLFIKGQVLNNEIVYLLSSHFPMIILGLLFSISWLPNTLGKLFKAFPRWGNALGVLFHLLLAVILVSLLI